MDEDNKLYYTTIKVENDDLLYIIIKQEKREYAVVNLILKPQKIILKI